MDCSLPGSSIHGIFQARVLEWAAISFSKSQIKRDPNDHNGGGGLVAKLCLTLVTPWTVACQAPLPMAFPR